MTVRTLLVDDQAMVRTGFRMILEAAGDIEVVGEASDGADAISQARALAPDVVLMDIQMPNLDGLEATRALVRPGTDRGPKVMILTTFERDDYIFDALRAGASGFLLKNAPPEELVEAVRTVAEGNALLSPSVTKRIITEFSSASSTPLKPSPELDRLTERETEVLQHVATGATNAEIAAALFVGEATVKTHVSNLLTKLGMRDRVQLVVFAYEGGLIEPGQS
jgi:DNA-binding NarL/FixJ family response regulator